MNNDVSMSVLKYYVAYHVVEQRVKLEKPQQRKRN